MAHKKEKRFTLLLSDITPDSAAACIENLFFLSSQSRAPILLMISSVGGDMSSAFALYDVIKSLGAPVIGVVYAQCHSSAGLVLQACHLRIMAPAAMMLLHEGSLESISAPDIKEAKAEIAAIEHDEGQYFERMSSRTGLSIKQIKAFEKAATYFNAESALGNGLIDDVLEGSVWDLPKKLTRTRAH